MTDSVLVIGADIAPTRSLADSLACSEFVAFPHLASSGSSWEWSWDEDLEGWETSSAKGMPNDKVVVCCWDEETTPRSFNDVSTAEWISNVEQRMAMWFVALRVAVRRCADGGSIVLVVERPAALDVDGQSCLVTAAEGMISLVSSVAAAEGFRGVRANSVVTEVWTAPDELLGPAPALVTFPGRIDREIVGAIRLLLSEDAIGITASVTTPDGGRASR